MRRPTKARPASAAKLVQEIGQFVESVDLARGLDLAILGLPITIEPDNPDANGLRFRALSIEASAGCGQTALAEASLEYRLYGTVTPHAM